MNLSELDDTEGLAMVALLRLMVRLDGRFTDEERAVLDDVAEDMGRDRFWGLIESAGHDASEADQIKSIALRVERPEAQSLIYSVVADLAQSDTVGLAEGELLNWLATAWKLDAE